jgi:UDP-3-O-[3-hydroxymyristoyl] N-acetylglucosamine deacetylase
MKQKTLKDIVSFAGVGLHTGCHVNVRLIPSGDDTGIVFIRKDIPGAPCIKAKASNVVATNYATSLGINGATVGTVEHLLAAFYGLGVDNAIVELDGPEVPILDGSAELFIKMIEGVGLKDLESSRKYLVVRRPIKVSEDDKYVLLMPAGETEFTVDYSIDFAHPFLSKQTFSKLFSADVFKKEVGSARTFGFLRDLEMLRANGLARGGSLSNAVVISDTEVLNEGGLRYPDEFVRHKVLDMMGDISLVGAPIAGHLIAHRSGHALNLRLVEQILKKASRWELIDKLADKDLAGGRRPFFQKVATV